MRRCSQCSEELVEDQEYWCVAVNREREEFGGITVLFADEALVTCMKCLPTYDRTKLVESALRASQALGVA